MKSGLFSSFHWRRNWGSQRVNGLTKVSLLTCHNSLVFQAASFLQSGARNNHVLAKVLTGNRKCTQRLKKIEKNVVNACKVSLKLQGRLNLQPLGRAPENAVSHLHKLCAFHSACYQLPVSLQVLVAAEKKVSAGLWLTSFIFWSQNTQFKISRLDPHILFLVQSALMIGRIKPSSCSLREHRCSFRYYYRV